MQIGLSLPFMIDPGAPDPCHRVYALAQLAEEAGFDFLSIGHHVFTPGYPTSAPFVILSGIAARTSRIKLASVIYLLPLYHPVAVAEQVATLDVMSGGRVIFGVGIGYRDYEFTGFGVDPRQRGARTDEALDLIRGGWSSGTFDYEGTHFTVKDLPAVPRPVQDPFPPIWVGGVSKPALRRAAQRGDGWVSANMQPLDDIVDLIASYRSACTEAGKEPFVCISRDAWVSASREEMLAGWYGDMVERHVGFRKMGFVSSDPGGVHARLEAGEPVDPDQFIADRLIGGTPDDCIREITRWQEATGCQALLLLMNKKAGFEDLVAQIRLFGRDVLPRVRGKDSDCPASSFA